MKHMYDITSCPSKLVKTNGDIVSIINQINQVKIIIHPYNPFLDVYFQIISAKLQIFLSQKPQ
jgi:hypothetical protein